MRLSDEQYPRWRFPSAGRSASKSAGPECDQFSVAAQPAAGPYQDSRFYSLSFISNSNRSSNLLTIDASWASPGCKLLTVLGDFAQHQAREGDPDSLNCLSETRYYSTGLPLRLVIFLNNIPQQSLMFRRLQRL